MARCVPGREPLACSLPSPVIRGLLHKELVGQAEVNFSPMNNIIRNVLSIMAGTFVAVVLIAIVQAVAHQFYPPPPGFDFEDKEALAQLMMQAPLGALLMVLGTSRFVRAYLLLP